MASKDFKVRHSLTVAENATIEGNLTLGGNTVSRILDSDEVSSIITSGNSISVTAFKYTATGNLDSEFSGADDNGLTLSYVPQKIDVFLNGILLSDTVDYIATSGTSVVLVNAPDSDDILTIKRYFGTENAASNLNISSFTFTATGSLDSEFSGADDDGNNLSYVKDKVQVFLNGILLKSGTDYTASNGSSITLTVAPDSDDILTVIKFLGTTQAGFDSDQVVAIIGENPDSTKLSLSGGTMSGDIDGNGNKVLFANVYAQLADLPNASTYHGMFAHVHATGAAYFAHGGVWIRLASYDDLTSDSDLKAISDLRNDVDSDSLVIQIHSGKIDDVEARIDSETSRIAILEYRADSDETALQTLSTKINTVNARLDSDDPVIQSNTSRIATLESRADSDETKLQTNTSRIDVLESRADSDETKIQDLQTQLLAVTGISDSDLAVVSKLRNDLDSESIQISALRRDIDSDNLNFKVESTFGVVNNGASAYTFTGDGFPSTSDNPDLHVSRGATYKFEVNASGHPFQIRESNGGSAYSNGVVNNGAQSGNIFFTVPMNAPKSLYYQCTVHSGMGGNIYVVSGNAGNVDSDLATVSVIRNDLDSESTQIRKLRSDLDSESAVIRQLRAEQDSDSAESGGSGGASGGGLDSDSILNLVAGSSTIYKRFDFRAQAPKTEFTGADMNNEILSYSPGTIQVFLNGVLLQDSEDYTASNGTSVVLTQAADSEDVLVVSSLTGNTQTLDVVQYYYTTVAGDSEISGADINGQVLTYSEGKIQVFLNGILMRKDTDYTEESIGTKIIFITAPDSDDQVTIVKNLGSGLSLNIDRFDYTATQNQTAFSGSDDNSNSLSYDVGKIQVYLNGLLLKDTTDYVADNGSTVSLVTNADSDDILSVVKYIGHTQRIGFDSDQIRSQVLELLKPVVAASSDFSDFQSRIAAL